MMDIERKAANRIAYKLLPFVGSRQTAEGISISIVEDRIRAAQVTARKNPRVSFSARYVNAAASKFSVEKLVGSLGVNNVTYSRFNGTWHNALEDYRRRVNPVPRTADLDALWDRTVREHTDRQIRRVLLFRALAGDGVTQTSKLKERPQEEIDRVWDALCQEHGWELCATPTPLAVFRPLRLSDGMRYDPLTKGARKPGENGRIIMEQLRRSVREAMLEHYGFLTDVDIERTTSAQAVGSDPMTSGAGSGIAHLVDLMRHDNAGAAGLAARERLSELMGGRTLSEVLRERGIDINDLVCKDESFLSDLRVVFAA
jgi:hypothetical protein